MKIRDIIPEPQFLSRLTSVYADMRRQEIASALAEGHEDATEVDMYRRLLEVENEIMQELRDEIPKGSKPVVRVMLQERIIEKGKEVLKEEEE